MRVLYDSLGFDETFGGVSHSFCQLVAHLPREVEPVLAVRTTCNAELQGAPFCVLGHPDGYGHFLSPGDFRGKWRLWTLAQRLFPGRYPNYEAANDACLEDHLTRGDFDVLHLTGAHDYGNAWRKVLGKKPIVVTVHDLIPEIIQDNNRVRARRNEILSAASQVIAVSENTKRDIIRLYGTPEGKISVVHHGRRKVKVEGQGQRWRTPYLLFVGKRGGYKNWAWFVEAVAPLLKKCELQLVCTGLPFSWGERQRLTRLGIADRVEQRCVPTEALPALYADAESFVYPSRYEGFGLPILDAWAAECPAVLARASCFPEVAGDAVEYFDLDDAQSLRDAIERARRRERVEAGRVRLQDYTWERCAAQTAEVYRKAVR